MICGIGYAGLHVLEGRDENIAQGDDLIRLSASAFLPGCASSVDPDDRALNGMKNCAKVTHVLVPQVLEELQLPIRPLAEYRCGEWLHDLFDSD